MGGSRCARCCPNDISRRLNYFEDPLAEIIKGEIVETLTGISMEITPEIRDCYYRLMRVAVDLSGSDLPRESQHLCQPSPAPTIFEIFCWQHPDLTMGQSILTQRLGNPTIRYNAPLGI